MSVTDCQAQSNPIERDEETDTVRCANCGTPASCVQGRPEWCVVCAQSIDDPGDGTV